MKSFILLLITFYQIIISPAIKLLLGVKSQCRYPLSCSAYAKSAIKEHGVLRGSNLALLRLLSCQPFAKSYGNI